MNGVVVLGWRVYVFLTGDQQCLSQTESQRSAPSLGSHVHVHTPVSGAEFLTCRLIQPHLQLDVPGLVGGKAPNFKP